MTALFAAFGLFVAVALDSGGYLRDPDIWWHMKVGDWIVQHHAVPFAGILSRTAASRPWIAYSWGFEVLVSRVFACFGLVGFAYFGIVLYVMVSVAVFAACWALSRRFWRSWLLTVLGTFAFAYSLYPRPVFFSMVLFMLMLYMLMKAERSGRIQVLYWYPLLFLVWANIHIQFIYGLATIGLYFTVDAVLRLASRASLNVSAFRAPTLPLGRLTAILAASFAACCVGPYTYRLFLVVFGYSKATQTYFVIEELQSPKFQIFTNYIFLFVVLAAFYAVGWRKKIDAFRLSLLIVATLCAFRTVRDAWFAAIPAVMFLADFPAAPAEQDESFKIWELGAVTGALIVLAVLMGGNIGFNNARGIDARISYDYPVDAANFLQRTQPPGPLYNDFDWGGFLTWYLPDYPVVVDGRNDLYGDEFVARQIQFKNTDRTDGNPQLDESRVVLLENEASLTKLLKVDPRFRVIYEDRIATIFLRN